jgi:hypothetical protein
LEGGVDPDDGGGDGALASGVAQRGGDLIAGQLDAVGRCGRQGEDCAGFGAGQVGGGAAGEGGQQTRVVLAQQRSQFLRCLDAPPDRVLGGAGEHGDHLGLVAVGGQLAVGVGVGAQDVGQGHGIDVVGLGAGDGVPLPVAGHRHRVDRVDRPAGLTQGRDQQAAWSLDHDRDRILVAVTGRASSSSSWANPSADSVIRCLATSLPSASTRATSW